MKSSRAAAAESLSSCRIFYSELLPLIILLFAWQESVKEVEAEAVLA